MNSGVKVVKDNWKDVSIRFQREIESRISKVTLDTETQIKSYIAHPPGGPSPTAQARGKAGLIDLGNYVDSWLTDVSGTNGEVGTAVEYGVYLEYGTRNAPAYPHVVPAADKIRRAMADYFKRLDSR